MMMRTSIYNDQKCLFCGLSVSGLINNPRCSLSSKSVNCQGFCGGHCRSNKVFNESPEFFTHVKVCRVMNTILIRFDSIISDEFISAAIDTITNLRLKTIID